MDIFTKPMSYKEFIKYLTPSVLTMVFLSFYTTIDGYFVSRYGTTDALAGINIVIPITCVIFGTSVMLATGAGAIIGNHMGKRNKHRADEIFSTIALVLLLLSLLFSIVGIAFLKPIAVFLGASERLLPHVMPYELIVFAGTIPMAFKLFFEYLVRTDGSPSVALKMSVVGLIMNLILDYLFVGVFRLGTLGAALGTVLSISISALMGLIYFKTTSTIKFCKPTFDFSIIWRSCTNGSSELLTELSTGITTLIFNLIIIKTLGEDGVAAVTIIMYIYYFFVAFYMGITVATAPIVSYNLGARNKAKIRETLKHSFLTIGLTAFFIMMILLFGGKGIIGLFAEPGHVFDLTVNALFYFSPVFLFIGINVFMSGYFTAVGQGLTFAIISLFRTLIFVILYILILPKIFGTNGIWLTMPFAEITAVVISLTLYFRRGRTYILE